VNVQDATRPTSRILAMLELLQDRPGMSGPALATELGVTTRTIRRYVVTLQDMGIPVEPAAGRTGGYWLRPGFRLPPLMFSADEAIGLSVALLGTRTSSTDELPMPVTRALAKIERVLPKELANQIATIRDGFTVAEMGWPTRDAFPDPSVLAKVTQAAMSHQRCWMRYGRPDGDQTAREIDPYGVLLFSGLWYVHGWCHLRKGTRTFRVDRIRRIDVLPRQFDPPDGFDVQDAVLRSIANAWTRWQIEIEVAAPVEEVRAWIPPTVVVLESVDADRTRMIGGTENLDWFATRLGELPFPMTIRRPAELGPKMREIGERMLAMAATVASSAPRPAR
jgi:predicted DNA-binding transcriptional regulator YafY